jgi:bacillopeptidase F (M6 metalloprotease family)
MLNKVLILSLTALLVVAVGRIWAQAPDTLWSENWENPDWLNDWHVDAGTWEVGTPNAGPNGAYSGQQCAGTVLAGNYPSNANTRLIRHTSFIVPSANQNPRLRFWHWYNIYSDDQAYVQIKVEEGDWQTISETYTNTGSGIWTYPAIDLSAYSDSTVQIAFYFHSGGYNNSTGWYIDDIVVLTGPLVYNNPESWEAGLGDWYADRGTWEVGEPTSGPGSAYSGQNCLATVLAGNYSGSASSRFISPAFILPGASENPNLTFWHWYNIYSDDEAFVQIRVVGGNWETILGPYTNTSGGIWSPTYADLSWYADSTVQIAFYFHSGGYNNSTGWYIDDINIMPYIITGTENSIKHKIPKHFQLSQNYPNPFNPSTTIEFNLPKTCEVTLKVFNILGEEVATLVSDRLSAGSYSYEWDASNLASGIYLYRLAAEGYVETKKMMLMK